MTLFERIVNWLFPLKASDPHQDERDLGFLARLEGLEVEDNPFAENSDQAKAWDDGWVEADAWASGQF